MNNTNYVNVNSKPVKKIVIAVVIILALLILGLSSFTIVDPGHTGVVVNLGKVSSTVLEEGIHFKVPFITQVVQVDNRVLKTEVESNAASKDLQTISTKVSINYRVNKSASADIYKNVGTDFTNVIVNPAIQECVKSIAAKYTAEQLITNRETVSSEMEDSISQKINPYGLTIEVFNIVNFDFSEEFNKAIEAKQTAQQEALKAEQDLARIKVEAEQTIEKAKAEAEAYNLKNAQLTDKIIMMEFIDKWDGELPKVASDAGAMFDVSSYIGASVDEPDSGNTNNNSTESDNQ
ncbi:prohibitin family protein [Porcipelethomonas sp.]|uniref:prohibitin family protein n=1 Tax=Porcipelethomonas sp. TaxID=2981675 RepID=UPI003EF22AE3